MIVLYDITLYSFIYMIALIKIFSRLVEFSCIIIP
jgi:hypothetical protein